jgi:hypothetical protein
MSPMMHFSKVDFSGPVGAHEGDGFSRIDGQVNPEQGLGGAIVGGEAFDGQ